MRKSLLSKYNIYDFDVHILIHAMVATVGLRKTKACFAYYVEIVNDIKKIEDSHQDNKK